MVAHSAIGSALEPEFQARLAIHTEQVKAWKQAVAEFPIGVQHK